MRLSTRARYALRFMLDLARHGGEDKPVSLPMISGRTGISRGYLEQLVPSLRNSRLVRALAGRYGGYKLARSPSEITIGQIVEATIGPVCVVDCVEAPESCLRSDHCECRIVYSLINQRIASVLEEFTLADLTDPTWVRTYAQEANGTLLGIDPKAPGGTGTGN